ncbi:MFS transporter [Dactylosporangium matsuzakiense]|uniref:MFS transporter n=1 Tax=Dactylosporangium matsuzakiense TaxID=53360 RepID=A0A9W6NKB9_9ACTN|nr:MFS transporter [Dactylosporangium matsuzakiense]GLL00760.1 MFS transporter [Dactylosporangium matsuzakiense]
MTVRDLSIDLTRQRRVLSVLVFAAVLIWIDTTILGIALERIADPRTGLGATPGELQWAVGSYALLFATALFAAGALGDRYGHRTILVLGLLCFGAASIWAAWAGDATGLILARGLMGLGGAMMMPTSMAIIGATFPPERRAGAIAIWAASSGVGVALGPLLGGVLVDHFWWGSVFLVNLPVVALALIGIALAVPNPKLAQRRRPDPIGLLLSTGGLAALAYGLIEAGQDTDWARPAVWGPVAAGLALLVLFTVFEWRTAEPSFDPRLFRSFRFSAGNLALAALFFAITGQMFYGNFYLQGARGMSALDTGFAFLPSALGVAVGSVLGARLVKRFGLAWISGVGLLVVAGAFLTNLAFDVDTPLVWFCAVGLVSGTAMGMTIAPTSAAVIAALPLDRMGAGSAVNNTLRQVGSVLGIALLGTVLTTAYRDRIAPALTGLPASARDAAAPSAEHTRAVADALHRPDLTQAANDAFIAAMHVTAATAALVAFLGGVLLIVAFTRRTSGRADAAGRPQPDRERRDVAEVA